MSILFILNDPPYGTERSDNALRLARRFASGARKILLCGTCMDARGLTETDLMDGARRSSMDELAEATLQADRVLVF